MQGLGVSLVASVGMRSKTHLFQRLVCTGLLCILLQVGRIGAFEVGDMAKRVGQRSALDLELE